MMSQKNNLALGTLLHDLHIDAFAVHRDRGDLRTGELEENPRRRITRIFHAYVIPWFDQQLGDQFNRLFAAPRR